jgi:hypothetical protein
MADHYDKLTESEKAYWDIYTRLRDLSDWAGFDDRQDEARQAARDWLVNQRKFIWRCAEGKVPGYKPGWDINQRSQRYEQLKDDKLNNGTCRRLCQLPTSGGMTDSEKVFISEREMWWRVNSVDDQTKKWRQRNADWLTSRRKQVWHLMYDPTPDDFSSNRKARYNNLCIATKTGTPYDEWAKKYNTTTGEPKSGGGKSSRSKCKDWLDSYLGVSESPPNSNKGQPQPSKWQQRVYGDDGVPWCACFAVCSAWDQGISGSGTAGVANNTQLAKQGKGIYKGYTTDPSKIHAGDHAFIGDDHTGVVYDRDKGITVEGNTSPGSEGSQYNGGCVAKRQRGWGYWTGFGLVRFPDD